MGVAAEVVVRLMKQACVFRVAESANWICSLAILLCVRKDNFSFKTKIAAMSDEGTGE